MAMSEWQPLLQSIFIGLIFSFLVAKLISIVVSFKDDNLTVTRNTESNSQSNKSVVLLDENPLGLEADLGLRLSHETESMIAELGSVRNESLPCSDYGDDDDDWEGVESTELDEMFSAATAFVAATAATSSGQKVSSDVQLQLYGLYKIATEGPCSTPQPSALKMTARAKWQAWQKLGAMPPEVAMQKYIDIVTELYPTWAAGLSAKSRGGDDDAVTRESKGPMGPVFSSLVYEEEPGNELRMDAIHAFAREGDVSNLVTCIENGVSVNLREMPSRPAAHLQNSSPELFVELIDLLNSEGRTPLHWAVDRGHLNVCELLVSRNADVNAKDNEGQTPLHYAVVCERKAVAEFLVKQNADIDIQDNDGNSPCANWPWMRGAVKQSD